MNPSVDVSGRGDTAPSESRGRRLPRTRLVEGLNAARAARVVLLEAPAGYSKSTTLRLWEESDQRPFAWLECQPRMDDPALLVEALIEALGRTDEIDPDVLLALSTPVPDLAFLLNRLSEVVGGMEPFVLVIDDAHLIQSHEAWQVVYSVVAALPERAQVAVATRTHPGLPVGRLRARGELHEITMDHLALTRRESRELLSSLDLEVGDWADEIHEKAEGWPAALYLAGLAIRDGGDSPLGELSFDGGDRVVVEYFRDELFQGMPEAKAQFLYRTSILEELDGPLCDALTGRTDSALMLEELSLENALVVPLDRGRTRFRYHHLFGDMLRSELHRREPEAEPELHHRAAQALAARSEIPTATDHAIASGDYEFAGALIWLDIADTTGRGRTATLERWFEMIGRTEVEKIPSLILTRAHYSIVTGESDQAYYWLGIAERQIKPDSPTYGDLMMLRTTIGPDGPARMLADADKASELLDPTNTWHAVINLYRGIALFLEEDEGAEELFRINARETINVSPLIHALALSQLALAELERDRVDDAYTHITRAREQVERSGLGSVKVMILVFAVLAKVQARKGRAAEAAEALEFVMRSNEGMEDFLGWYESEILLISCRTMLRIGQHDRAAALASRAEEVVTRMGSPARLVRWIEEIREALGKPRADTLNLTKAELRTLQFLPSHHSFRAIGEQLYLSQNTVKTQANSLYRKLGVNSRAEAVMEGRRLKLIEGDPS